MKTLLSVLLLIPTITFAENEMYKKDEDNLTYKLVNGVYILWAGEMEPVTVTAS